jgi:N-acetyl-anhydromuramyl-L-alanine amidase AmpD
MRVSPGHALSALAAVAALAAPGAADAARLIPRPPPVQWLPGTVNFTPAKRKPQQIRLVVIHVSEGSFFGTLAWLRNPAAKGSANFVVSRDGKIVELVAKKDIAWHAGNWAVNLRSVGIEHVGVTDDPTGFSRAEYRASARLSAYLARTSLIPIDREHFIGHSDVPDPTDPLVGGGIDNHTDPGRYWNWKGYLRLVRRFAFPEVRRRHHHHRHVGLEIASTTLTGGAVTGTVPWRVQVRGPVQHVAFLVDGKTRWVDHRRPFAFAGERGLRTETMRDGRHRLELRAYGPRGSWTRDHFVVRVHNVRFALAVSGLRPGQPVTGVVPVRALAEGAKPIRVALLVDGREVDHDTSTPYVFRWDSGRVPDGTHVLALRARALRGRFVTASVAVVVANTAPAVSIVAPLDRQQVSGVVPVQVQTSGRVRSVDLIVDGEVVASATTQPWRLLWDTSTAGPGEHVVTVRANGQGGSATTASVDVTVVATAA